MFGLNNVVRTNTLRQLFSVVSDLMYYMLQLVHPSRILKLRVRGTKKDLMQETSSEEISIVLPGIIARFDGSNIQVKR